MTTHASRIGSKLITTLAGVAVGALWLAVFHGSLSPELTRNEALHKTGVEASATVTAVHCYGDPSRENARGAPPEVRYSYHVGTATFEGRGGVQPQYQRPNCGKLQVGALIPITYAATDLSASWPVPLATVGELPRHSTYWLFEAISFLAFFGIGASLAGVAQAHWKRKRAGPAA